MKIKLEFRADTTLNEALELVHELSNFVEVEGLEFKYLPELKPAVIIIASGTSEEAQFKQKILQLTDTYNVVDFRIMANSIGGDLS